MNYGWGYQGMGGGWWAFMMIGMIIFWAILVIGIVALVRHYRPGPGGAVLRDTSDTAISILKERLARGEITEEQYTSLLATLNKRS